MAETRNPFGGNVLPFRRGAPLPEGGGGGFAPRPANRFEEIMQRVQRNSYRGRTGGELLNPPEVARALSSPGKPVEPAPAPPKARDFMSRRGEQLAREAAQKRQAGDVKRSVADRMFDGEVSRRAAAQAASQKKAEAMVERLSKPRPADAEVRAEQGLDLARPVAERGRVNQYSRARDASIFHDPVTGVTRVRRGAKSREFASRREALEALQQGDPFGAP